MASNPHGPSWRAGRIPIRGDRPVQMIQPRSLRSRSPGPSIDIGDAGRRRRRRHKAWPYDYEVWLFGERLLWPTKRRVSSRTKAGRRIKISLYLCRCPSPLTRCYPACARSRSLRACASSPSSPAASSRSPSSRRSSARASRGFPATSSCSTTAGCSSVSASSTGCITGSRGTPRAAGWPACCSSSSTPTTRRSPVISSACGACWEVRGGRIATGEGEAVSPNRTNSSPLIAAELGAPGQDALLYFGVAPDEALAGLGPRARRAVGMHPSRTVVQRARARLHSAGLNHCVLQRGELAALPHPSRGFDVVVVDRVLATADRPADALREAARVLRPAGRLLVIEDFESLERLAPRQQPPCAAARVASRRGARLQPPATVRRERCAPAACRGRGWSPKRRLPDLTTATPTDE